MAEDGKGAMFSFTCQKCSQPLRIDDIMAVPSILANAMGWWQVMMCCRCFSQPLIILIMLTELVSLKYPSEKVRKSA